MGNEALKPCPFCGGGKIDPQGWSRNDGVSGPACDNCGASAESIEAWNTRAPATASVIDEIAAERKRQIEVEGWMAEHDDEHVGGEIALAAGCYALASTGAPRAPDHWPWAPEWFKPKDSRADLIRAGALIVAEIERLDRSAATIAQEGT